MIIKRCMAFAVIIILVVIMLTESVSADTDPSASTLKLACTSAILMEARTGQVIFEQNADEALPPASVTKIMTLLITMEAIESGVLKFDDMLTCSANAASMGGSQVFLEEGEQMSVDELIKCVVICSANDAAVMLAEAVAGSEDAFVDKMNRRATELGMTNTVFENTNGLDDTAQNHVTSARDIAIMSRELIGHKKILEYSSIWMDSIRGGSFGLTNTNRLVRFYPGATGLKTGSTAKAKFCISATAERNGMHLICVIMGADTRDIRNAAATQLLDWGFANYSLYEDSASECDVVPVRGGVNDFVSTATKEFCCLVPKGLDGKVVRQVILSEYISAPVSEGDVVGSIKYICNEQTIGEADIIASQSIDTIGFKHIIARIFLTFMF